MSMDALFGLPLKKSAGISYRDALHGHLFFGQQEMVDEHVALASQKYRKEPKVCIVRYCSQHEGTSVMSF